MSQPYWDGAALGELRYQRCASCGEITVIAGHQCGHCLSQDLRWEVSSGRGTLYSWTVVHRPQTPAFVTPYAPAIVAMEEGWWLLASVIGCDVDDLIPDMALEVDFHPAGDGIVLPYVRPAAPS